MKREFAFWFFIFGFCLASVLAFYEGFNNIVLFFSLVCNFVFLICLLIFLRSRSLKRIIILSINFIFFGFNLGYLNSLRLSKVAEFKPEIPICLKVTIIENIKNKRVIAFNEQFGKIYLKFKFQSDQILLGDQLFIYGQLSLAKNIQETNYLRSQSVKAKLDKVEILKFTEQKPNFYKFLGKLQTKFLKIHKIQLRNDESALMQGMLVGRSSGKQISPEIWQLGQNLGLIHLFAASAMNLGILILALKELFKLFRFSRKLEYLILFVAISFYTGLSGFIPSIMRAWFMVSLVLLGSFNEKKKDILNILLIVFLLSLLFAPDSIGDLGFQFSYLATLGLILWTAKLTHYFKFLPHSWAEPLAAIICAQALILPLQLFYFGNISFYSILANLFALYIASTAMISGLIASLLSCFGSIGWILAGLPESVASLCLSLLLCLMRFLGHLPFSDFKFGEINLIWVIWLYFIILALGAGFWQKYKLTKHFILAISLFLVILQAQSESLLTLQSFSSLHYEALMIKTVKNQNILICKSQDQLAAQKINIQLKKLNLKSLNWLIGDCENLEIPIKNQINLKSKIQSKQIELEKDLILKLSEKSVLLIYKNFSALILFEPVSSNNSSDFYSLIKFVYPKTLSKNNFWNNSPKAEFCLMPHLTKPQRIETNLLLKNKCDQSIDYLKAKSITIKTNGVFIGIPK